MRQHSICVIARVNYSRPSKIPIQRASAPPYEPPPGFTSASITLTPGSEIGNVLSSSALQGKQLWHVTVPTSVPVSSITEIPTNSISTGAAVLSYNGAEYGLISEPQDRSAQMTALIPSSKSDEYESASIGIANTFHLQQIVRIPKPANGLDKRANGTSTRSGKQKHQQPPGLKMRYRPFGVSSEAFEESDSEPIAKESLQATPFRVPKNIDIRRTDQFDGQESPEKPKRKKHSASSGILKDFEQAQRQQKNQSISPAERFVERPPAELQTPLHSPTKFVENEAADTPLPKSHKKRKMHHHQETNGHTPLSKPTSLTKLATLTPSPLSNLPTYPATQYLQKNPTELHRTPKDLLTSPENSNSEGANPVKKPRSPAMGLDAVQQHAGSTEDRSLRVSKKDETAEERARRKAERRKRRETENVGSVRKREREHGKL